MFIGDGEDVDGDGAEVKQGGKDSDGEDDDKDNKVLESEDVSSLLLLGGMARGCGGSCSMRR